MLEKGIIIIPDNLSEEQHWIATITMYNAGHIQNQSPGQPRAGFLTHIDPVGPKGSTTFCKYGPDN